MDWHMYDTDSLIEIAKQIQEKQNLACTLDDVMSLAVRLASIEIELQDRGVLLPSNEPKPLPISTRQKRKYLE
jgi:hypothetical protein